MAFGLAALLGAATRLATSWNDAAYDVGTDATARIGGFLSNLGSALVVTLLVALVVEPRSRRFALVGAAAWVLSRLVEAILQDHQVATLAG